MTYSELDLQDTEDEIRRYFRHLMEINRLKYRLNFLTTKKAQVESDINDSRISLNASIPGISYDSERVQSSSPKDSQQERALENAFVKLERQLDKINSDIMCINVDIRDLEFGICDTEFVLSRLEDNAREFLHLHYEKKIGYIKISDILHISTASLSRLRTKALCDIRSYSLYMKQK